MHAWQLPVEGFGEPGQVRLEESSVLVSRVGGLGGVVAYELAAAGVGRLVLAHAGELVESDLNRQLLMSHAGLGRSRVEQAAARLRAFKPSIEVVPIAENPSADNAARLLDGVDLVVDCAPRFEERFALNAAACATGTPMVECAMFELESSITTILPGTTPCLSCLVPSSPPLWKREFPVFGAVSGAVGCLAAMEAIKVLTGLGRTLAGRLLTLDLRSMRFSEAVIERRDDCAVCAPIHRAVGPDGTDGCDGTEGKTREP